MSGRELPTIGEIAAEYRDNKLNEELRGNWVIALVNRPPSFPFIWLAARSGLTPTAITFGGGALALTMLPVALWAPLPLAGPLLFLIAFVYQVVDCVDGGLARITHTGSEFGAQVDFLVDMAQWGFLYLSLGLIADRHAGDIGFYSAVAAAAAWVRLYVALFRFSVPSKRHTRTNAPLKAWEIPIAFLAGLSGAVPFLGLLGPWLAYAVPLLFVYSVLDLADAFVGASNRRAE